MLKKISTLYYNGTMNDHFDGKRFFDPNGNQKNSFLDFLKWQFTKPKNYWPSAKVPVISYDKPPSRVNGSDLRVSYVGHVTYLIQTHELNILTDPVWSDRASPLPFAGPKRIIDPGIKFEDLPPIDIVLVSHNHYDHLDLRTLKKLWQYHKPRIITPLGNDTIIKSASKDILSQAFDWGQTVKINNEVSITLEPMQHWSARGIFDRNKALWAAFVIQTPSGNSYFIGDSGYSRYFKAAKEKYNNFRLALLPIGAYEPRWFMSYTHMNPDDAMLAHIDLGEPYTIPGHYDVFKLTNEPYGDALIKLDEAKKKYDTGSRFLPLKVGEPFMIP